jgi:hypothetical protein
MTQEQIDLWLLSAGNPHLAAAHRALMDSIANDTTRDSRSFEP